MKTSKLLLFAIIVGFLGSACSGTIFKKFSIDDSPATSVSLDARQRLILVTEKGGPVPEKDGVPIHQHRVICAEPSPDAFMALVASGGADLTVGQKKLGAQASMAENVGALGRRTQTIQLLRDVLYRACEAYMNGVIDKSEYRKIMVGYDELVITLVAIESLGGTDKGPLPTVGGTATVNDTSSTSKTDSNLSTGAGAGTSSTSGASAGQTLNELVRNYYCFQLGLKQMFYHRKKDNLSVEIIETLCK